MAVRLRLTRMGRRHRPCYRLAAMDARAKRDGRVIEELGFFDPLAKDADRQLKVDTARAAYWLSVGAQPTDTVRTLLQRSGVEVKDCPGFEVRTLSQASREEAVGLLRQRGEDLLARGATGIMPSLARDLMAGRATEREAIFGFAVREADARNLAMHFTRHAYALITAIEQGAE